MKHFFNIEYYKACRAYDQTTRKQGMYKYLDALTDKIDELRTAKEMDKKLGVDTAGEVDNELKRMLRI
jgi:hypothetical protein